MTPPSWLAPRGGELKQGISGGIWHVIINGAPQYRLVVTPAKGKYACAIVQSNNGRRHDTAAEYADANAALDGGLAELRRVLGW